eukprot:TRINITY_DN14205_c0_g1_i1.p1 TRINITY_DN14205_c0_g1~~TRINITY_DN14205_c0_g1_i1.p1  ORF type:complete len:245 (-),score=38.11 TRINITY_DN14205_c0_g1_i1:77-811(-)
MLQRQAQSAGWNKLRSAAKLQGSTRRTHTISLAALLPSRVKVCGVRARTIKGIMKSKLLPHRVGRGELKLTGGGLLRPPTCTGAAALSYQRNMHWHVQTLEELRRIPLFGPEFGVHSSLLPNLCPMPPPAERLACHGIVPKGTVKFAQAPRNAQAVGDHRLTMERPVDANTEVALLQHSGPWLRVLQGGPAPRTFEIKSGQVTITHPVLLSYAEATSTLTVRFRVLSVESTLGVHFEFNVNGSY